MSLAVGRRIAAGRGRPSQDALSRQAGVDVRIAYPARQRVSSRRCQPVRAAVESIPPALQSMDSPWQARSLTRVIQAFGEVIVADLHVLQLRWFAFACSRDLMQSLLGRSWLTLLSTFRILHLVAFDSCFQETILLYLLLSMKLSPQSCHTAVLKTLLRV